MTGRWLLAIACMMMRADVAHAQATPEAVVTAFMAAMSRHDTVTMHGLVIGGATIVSTAMVDETPIVKNRTAALLITTVGAVRDHTWTEVISVPRTQITDRTAEVSGRYKFRIDGNAEYCGTTRIQLARDGEAWKIAAIMESQEHCK